MPIRASDLMHRKRDWTTESGLNDSVLGRAGGGAPPVSTRGATLPVGAQSMATRSEIERSSMVHEAAAAAGYSSIPLYVQSLRDDPERLDRLEWTAKFESELMRRLKSVGWDPSNVTAESTAAAFAAIGIPVSGWRGASERRIPTEFKAMSGGAPPSDPGDFVPLPLHPFSSDARVPNPNAHALSPYASESPRPSSILPRTAS
ncbi:MAG: hypothetical protein IV100_29440, partial [Myxococcales bacterium]|nr:hypothetical protein [Myxococcales bacterium]